MRGPHDGANAVELRRSLASPTAHSVVEPRADHVEPGDAEAADRRGHGRESPGADVELLPARIVRMVHRIVVLFLGHRSKASRHALRHLACAPTLRHEALAVRVEPDQAPADASCSVEELTIACQGDMRARDFKLLLEALRIARGRE